MGGYITPRTYAAELLRHPSFVVPPVPKADFMDSGSFNEIVQWALEAAASFISPSPKEDGEDEFFACEDVAQAVREVLPPLLKVRIKGR